MHAVPAQLDIADDIARFARMGLLRCLLKDRSTGQNVVWASNVFVDKGDSYAPSDIDWSQTVAGIDQQFYAKYDLSQDEIDFIESHVKEMQ